MQVQCCINVWIKTNETRDPWSPSLNAISMVYDNK